MAKIITVYGSAGSGKSVFCTVLAKSLTQKKQKVIILSNDVVSPMLPIWMPMQAIEPSQSIGTAFAAVNIDSAVLASKVILPKSYPFIGFLGYTASDTPPSYPQLQYEQVVRTIKTAGSLVDYLIIDCTSDIKNLVAPAGIELADTCIRIVTPDLKGFEYITAHNPILVDIKFRLQEHITLAGMARPYHPIEEMGHQIGGAGFFDVLPYQKEIDRSVINGDLLNANRYCGKQYEHTVERIREVVDHTDAEL